MSELSNDPYELVDEPQLELPGHVHRMSRLQAKWGLALLIAVIVGDLGIPSLRLGDGVAACIFIGLWLAQYVVLWILLRTYLASKLIRVLLGSFLVLSISLLATAGMSIAWPPGIPFPFIAMIMGGSLVVYALSGWMQSILFGRSGFNWFPDNQVGSSQVSIRMMLALMVLSAVLAMVSKALRIHTTTDVVLQSDYIPIIVWFIWLSLGIGLLSFVTFAAVRSKSVFFKLVFLAVSLVGPLILQTVGLWIMNFGKRFQGTQRLEYYLWTYAIEFGVVLGILAVIPLLPSPSRARIADESLAV